MDIQTGNKLTTLANSDRYGVVLGDNGGAGAMYQNGGVVDINAVASINNFMIGKSAGSFGHYGLNEGYLELTEFGIGSGSGGNGVLEVRGGTIKTTDYFLVSRGDSGTGQTGMVNLLGGTIQVDNGGANTWADLAFNMGFSGALSDHEVVDAGRGVDVHHTTVLIHRSGTAVITQHHPVPIGIGQGGDLVAGLDVDSSSCPSHVTDPQGIGRKVSGVTKVHESVVHR